MIITLTNHNYTLVTLIIISANWNIFFSPRNLELSFRDASFFGAG